MAFLFSGNEGSISAGGVGERLMGLSIFLVSTTDVAGSTGTEGSTDEGDEVCVSGVKKSGLSATRLSLLAAGADWGFCDFLGFFAAIRECDGITL